MIGTENPETQFIDGVPALWRAPGAPSAILVHVPAFGQTKEQAQLVLDHALAAGFAAIAAAPLWQSPDTTETAHWYARGWPARLRDHFSEAT